MEVDIMLTLMRENELRDVYLEVWSSTWWRKWEALKLRRTSCFIGCKFIFDIIGPQHIFFQIGVLHGCKWILHRNIHLQVGTHKSLNLNDELNFFPFPLIIKIKWREEMSVIRWRYSYMYAVILICIELLKMDGAFGRLCQVTFSFIIFFGFVCSLW